MTFCACGRLLYFRAPYAGPQDSSGLTNPVEPDILPPPGYNAASTEILGSTDSSWTTNPVEPELWPPPGYNAASTEILGPTGFVIHDESCGPAYWALLNAACCSTSVSKGGPGEECSRPPPSAALTAGEGPAGGARGRGALVMATVRQYTLSLRDRIAFWQIFQALCRPCTRFASSISPLHDVTASVVTDFGEAVAFLGVVRRGGQGGRGRT